MLSPYFASLEVCTIDGGDSALDFQGSARIMSDHRAQAPRGQRALEGGLDDAFANVIQLHPRARSSEAKNGNKLVSILLVARRKEELVQGLHGIIASLKDFLHLCLFWSENHLGDIVCVLAKT